MRASDGKVRLFRTSEKEALCALAELYAEADTHLERACVRKRLDPIACTVFALKKRHLDTIPEESTAAANALASLVSLHRELVCEHGMDPDEVRAVVFPILNRAPPLLEDGESE